MAAFLTVQQLANHLGLCRASVDRMVADGRLPTPIKLGASRNSPVRFNITEVEAFLAALKQGARA
jgi:excisionase family DNA binding protein